MVQSLSGSPDIDGRLEAVEASDRVVVYSKWLWLTFDVALVLRWRWTRCVPRINDVFHKVAVVSAAEADVARRRLQRFYEVPVTVHVDHTDLRTYIHSSVTHTLCSILQTSAEAGHSGVERLWS